MPLVSIVCGTTLSIVCAAGMAPGVVAKQIEPVITLSQVQGFRAQIMLTGQPVLKPKTRATTAKRAVSANKKKGRSAAVDHFRLGLALKAKGNSNKALIEFLKASQKNPRQINAFYEQALIFRKQGYLKLADSALEQAIRIAGSSAKNPQKKIKPQFTADDLNKIRLLLITVRLEQGNVGSAAEELGRSLGIALTVPQQNDNGNSSGTTGSAETSADSPTTILQSLHPKIEVGNRNFDDKPGGQEKTDEKPVNTEKAIAESERKNEKPGEGSTVSSLIKESLAGLKDHVFNPLSMLGLQRMSTDADAAKDSKKKEKRSRRNRKEPVKKGPKAETAKDADSTNVEKSANAETSIREESPKEGKRKRRSWFDRRLALARTPDVKPAEVISPEDKNVEKQSIASDNKTGEPESIEKDSSDLVVTSSTNESSTKDASWNTSETPAAVDGTRFSLTVPPAVSQKISLVAALLSAFGNDKASSLSSEKKEEKPKDPIEERLKYLAEHGTSSLKEGEAFMFSEESGEATLFMANGEVIRKTIAIARRHEEVAQLRRPDILIPEELIYNLALMAKILPKQEEAKETVGEPEEEAPKLKMPARISVPDSKAYSFSDWLRGVLNL